MAGEDRYKATFTTHAGTFQYKRIPFGLCNTPATFQHKLDSFLVGLKWSTCLAYMDDGIVYSDTFEDHPKQVDQVLSIVHEAGLTLSIAKCHFFRTFVDYLGHVVVPGRLKVAQKNRNSIKQANFTTIETELHSFPGMCDVYQRLVPKLSAVAEHLNQSLTKGMPTHLPLPMEDMHRSFDLLKTALTD